MKKIFYSKASYGQKEINAVLNVLKNPLSLMDGKNVRNFEKKVALLFGKKFALMVNSGSSANLLALQCLNLKKNSEIITPLLTFSTTVAPIYQLGFVASFIDVKRNTYLANIKEIEKSINENTKAILIPNLLGNIPDWKIIYKIAKKYNLKTIEDSADTIGYKYQNGNTGNLSDIVTCSFYASHIVTGAGFGGIVCFNDKNLYNKAKLLRGWGRSSALKNETENISQRFNTKLSDFDYDSKYIFQEFGYNFLPSEISAAFANEQLKKLNYNLDKRKKNFLFLKNYLKKNLKKYFYVPGQLPSVKTGWLAFPLLIKNIRVLKRKELQIFLEKNSIQTRTIFSGNILKQPLMKKKFFKVVKKRSYEADYVMKHGILIGCHNSMTKNELKYVCNKISKFTQIND
jgi:CDP-6-deoxy-D-xylo-4-hexulose-3-dehydrase